VADGGQGPFERRVQLRAAATFQVSYQSLDELVNAYTIDISQGGLFVRTEQILPVGDVVKIAVAWPDSAPMEVFARVAHVIGPEGTTAGREPGMGLEFLNLGETPLADRVARYLAQAGHSEPVPPPPAGATGTILVIEEDDNEREHMMRIIEDRDHRTVGANNAMNGLRMANESPPDLIVADVHDPALDGWQFARLVRARSALAAVPIVFVGSGLSDDDRLKGYQVGANDFVSRPYDDEELALHVQRTLERARAYPGSSNRSASLSGYLAHVSVSRVLSLLAAEHREGRLMLIRRGEAATIYFRDGTPVRVDLDAEHDQLQGPDRLHYVLSWGPGRFEFVNAQVEDEDQIGTSVAEALLQYLMLTGP
jgi:uncharacterized protein (TIGR02266 family)